MTESKDRQAMRSRILTAVGNGDKTKGLLRLARAMLLPPRQPVRRCRHPNRKRIELHRTKGKVQWCLHCGALRRNGRWKAPALRLRSPSPLFVPRESELDEFKINLKNPNEIESAVTFSFDKLFDHNGKRPND